MRSPGKRVKVKRCRRESEEVWHLDREEARVRRLSGREATSGCVLSERHPVAAGLMNTSVFVIIPHRQKGERWHLILTTRTTCRCWGRWWRGCACEEQGEPAQLAQQAETHIQVRNQSRLSPVVNFPFSGSSSLRLWWTDNSWIWAASINGFGEKSSSHPLLVLIVFK